MGPFVEKVDEEALFFFGFVRFLGEKVKSFLEVQVRFLHGIPVHILFSRLHEIIDGLPKGLAVFEMKRQRLKELRQAILKQLLHDKTRPFV